MANENLSTYLNDHLAGAELALELLRGLSNQQKNGELRTFAVQIREEIDADRKELEHLMSLLNISPSIPRRAVGWVTEKLAELKLKMDDPGDGALHHFEALEALQIGIEGKRAMWQAMYIIGPTIQGFPPSDYQRLIGRAKEQHDLTERRRLALCATALTDAQGPIASV